MLRMCVFWCFSDKCATVIFNWHFFEWSPAYLSSVLLPGLEGPERSVHGPLGVSRATVRHPGDLLPGGRVQDREHGLSRGPDPIHEALRPEQRSGHVQAVVSSHGGGQADEELPEEAARAQHTEGGHVG